ncbi:MAG: hypothetical protein ACKPEY_17550 [Planctomycetota bacterium]
MGTGRAAALVPGRGAAVTLGSSASRRRVAVGAGRTGAGVMGEVMGAGVMGMALAAAAEAAACLACRSYAS